MAENKSEGLHPELRARIAELLMRRRGGTQKERLKAHYVAQLQGIAQYTEIVQRLFWGHSARLVTEWLLDQPQRGSLSDRRFSGIYKHVCALRSLIRELSKQMLAEILTPEMEEETIEATLKGEDPLLDRKKALKYLAVLQISRVKRLQALEEAIGIFLPGGQEILERSLKTAIELQKLEEAEQLAKSGIFIRLPRLDQIGPCTTVSLEHGRGPTEAPGEAHWNRMTAEDTALVRALMKELKTEAKHPGTAQTQQEVEKHLKKPAR